MDQKKTLSEISHLFLSGVRQRQTSDAPRPKRVPPRKQPETTAETRDVSMDMTPEEFAESLAVSHNEDVADTVTSAQPVKMVAQAGVPQLSVILASHIPDATDRIAQYASHLAIACKRVGVIEIDSAELRVKCFEHHAETTAVESSECEMDSKRITETLEELAVDVGRWLLWLPNPRTPEARELLRGAPHWTLFTTSKHEGIVAAYRTLKGLGDMGDARISVVVLDADGQEQAESVYRKLQDVGHQFLGTNLEMESPVTTAEGITVHELLNCKSAMQDDLTISAPQWGIVAQFVARSVAPPVIEQPEESVPQPEVIPSPIPMPESAKGKPVQKPAEIPMSSEEVAPIRMIPMEQPMAEVIDLPMSENESGILDAVVRQGGVEGRWMQCPIRPPMCPKSILAIDRDRRLMLIAVAAKGLNDLRGIGLALRWMSENRELIRMALPQLAIDVQASPGACLLVDHADLSADILQPILQSDTISVQAYRKVKWGSKTGLLLEAA
jgi:hypothetical protein